MPPPWPSVYHIQPVAPASSPPPTLLLWCHQLRPLMRRCERFQCTIGSGTLPDRMPAPHISAFLKCLTEREKKSLVRSTFGQASVSIHHFAQSPIAWPLDLGCSTHPSKWMLHRSQHDYVRCQPSGAAYFARSTRDMPFGTPRLDGGIFRPELTASSIFY